MPLHTYLLSLSPLDYFAIPQATLLAPKCLPICDLAPFHTSCVVYRTLPYNPSMTPTDSVQTSYLRDKAPV